MAQITNRAGQAPLLMNGQAPPALRYGNSVTITTGAASAGAALPVDANGVAYAAYAFLPTQTCWFNFSNAAAGTDAAVAGAAGTYPAVGDRGVSSLVVPPAGTVSINAIQDAAAGKLCIIGLF